MKTKRIITAILAALKLATTLVSCSRPDQLRPPETPAPTPRLRGSRPRLRDSPVSIILPKLIPPKPTPMVGM